MSFLLPPVGHRARELMGDIATLANTLDPANAAKLPTTWQACKSARATFEADTTRAMSRVSFVVLRADNDERWLISCGPRGGWKKEWNFGNGRAC
jgi:hypothetical protein